MQQHLVEHRAQHIAAPVCGDGLFHRFGNRRAQRSCVVWVGGKNFAACLGGVRGARYNVRAECANDRLTERLLLVRAFHHIHRQRQMKIGARLGKCRAPLPRARFGGERGQALFFGIIGLCNRGIQLVAARGVVALEFVIDFGGCAEFFFEVVRANQRRGTVNFIHFLHFFGNVDIPRGVVHFLMCQFLTEYGVQIRFCGGFARGGIDHRVGQFFHIRPQVIPLFRHLVFGQIYSVRYFFHVKNSFLSFK